jgi:lysylphosphatidylglycerol synthetase-like protein (DUF2156 family)
MLKLRQPLQTEVLRYAPFVRSLLAITVACMAIINGLTVLLPARVGRLALLAILFNQLALFAASIWPFIQAGHTIALILGFFLLLVAGGLARGKRRAWQCAVVLLSVSALAHLVKGLDIEEAGLAMILWFALLSCEPYFRIKSDPWHLRQGLLLLIVGGVLLVLYSLSGFYVLQTQFQFPGSFGGFIRSLLLRIVNFPATELMPLTRHASWFLASMAWLSATALFTGMFFLLRPVCAPGACEHVTRSFLELCALQDWRVAFYQASPEHLATYHALKLHAFKIGEEAIIHPQSFTLSGSALANVRTSCRRAEREGVLIQWYEGVPPTEVTQQLEHLSNAWLERKGGKHTSEMGFSMGRLDELMDIADRADTVANLSTPPHVFQRAVPRLVTGVVTTSSGKACAFVTFTPIYGFLTIEATATGSQGGVQGWGWTLDLMRRSPDAPPGVIELLLVRVIERFRSCGAQVVSLGLVAMADTRQEITAGQRQLASFVTDRLRLLETRRTLFYFKQRFHPHWESRYVVASTTLALPKIALAVLRVHESWKYCAWHSSPSPGTFANPDIPSERYADYEISQRKKHRRSGCETSS